MNALDPAPPPSLVRGVTVGEDGRASAVLRFEPRSLAAVGTPVVAPTGLDLEVDLAGQPALAAAPLDSAWQRSCQTVRHVLERAKDAFAMLFDDAVDEGRILVTARVDRRDLYVPLQGAHIDWARTKTFTDDDWVTGAVGAEGSLRDLAACHSLDCVLGAPPTEFFLDEQLATIWLVPQAQGGWTVDAIDFDPSSRPCRGVTGRVLYRPPFTVHRFPGRGSWTEGNEVRVFVSCDYWLPTGRER